MGDMRHRRVLLVLRHESDRKFLIMDQPISDEIRARKRALLIFQLAIYGFLLAMFIVQLVMWSQRHW
jgi:hypothetical protein